MICLCYDFRIFSGQLIKQVWKQILSQTKFLSCMKNTGLFLSWKTKTILWMISWSHFAIFYINGVYYFSMFSFLFLIFHKMKKFHFIWILLFLIIRPNLIRIWGLLENNWYALFIQILRYSFEDIFNLINSHFDVIFKENERHSSLK